MPTIITAKYVKAEFELRSGLSRVTTTECAFAKWSQTNERDVGAAAAARIVRRFHRQAARANLHCGGNVSCWSWLHPGSHPALHVDSRNVDTPGMRRSRRTRN